jgi:tetrahydromethanopterin S-methyltransferase subunit G
VNDPVSAREAEQRFAEVYRRIDGIESRLTGLAKDAVMVNVWSLENSHIRDLIATGETRSKERHTEIMAAVDDVRTGINRRSEWTWQRAIGVSGVVVGVIALLITVLVATKGIR